MLPYVWQTGIGRGWPLTADEEAAFGDWLPDPGTTPTTRNAITTALLITREGATRRSAEAVGVYLDWAAIAAAWAYLTERFTTARDAWNTLISEPGTAPATLVSVAADAARLAPIPVAKIVDAASYRHAADVAAHTAARTCRIGADVAAMETAMAAASPAAAFRIGAALYNPYTDESMWADPYFVPTRPGQLTPLRLEALLDNDPLPDSP